MAPKRKAAAAKVEVEDYSKKTVAELKKLLAKRKLDAKGAKAALIQRLQDNDSGADADSGPSPPKLHKKSTIETAVEQMRASARAEPERAKVHKVDGHFPNDCDEYDVHLDYDCMLNQTNIGHNNNKYYVIQVLSSDQTDAYLTFCRWGRVGEPGATMVIGPYEDPDEAIAAFKKKFHDKTKNNWDKRGQFKPVKGKYTMIEVNLDDEDEEDNAGGQKTTNDGDDDDAAVAPSKLDKETQKLVKLIFNKDMFCNAMAQMEIDTKKMPLGKLGKMQIVKGFEVLDELKKVLEKKKSGNMTELSSQFYTVIPHDFGRQRPPVINTMDALRKKLDMLITLGDIELAQSMLKSKEEAKAKKKKAAAKPNPIDENYALLKCQLHKLGGTSADFKVIKKYFEATMGHYSKAKLAHVWKMDRDDEDKRFSAHKSIAHRKLLWHGTNVAVVAAICKGGLRIMPHSGGRVGRGLYFASEMAKSAGYVGRAGNVGIMFLNEVALGKEKAITSDDSSLTAAPKGYDSVVAMGHTEPDPKQDEKLKVDGREIIVPQGKPVTRKEYTVSSFTQSEYLVYKESQVRMRYLLMFDFGGAGFGWW